MLNMYRLIEAVDAMRANSGNEHYAIDEASNMLSIVTIDDPGVLIQESSMIMSETNLEVVTYINETTDAVLDETIAGSTQGRVMLEASVRDIADKIKEALGKLINFFKSLIVRIGQFFKNLISNISAWFKKPRKVGGTAKTPEAAAKEVGSGKNPFIPPEKKAEAEKKAGPIKNEKISKPIALPAPKGEVKEEKKPEPTPVKAEEPKANGELASKKVEMAAPPETINWDEGLLYFSDMWLQNIRMIMRQNGWLIDTELVDKLTTNKEISNDDFYSSESEEKARATRMYNRARDRMEEKTPDHKFDKAEVYAGIAKAIGDSRINPGNVNSKKTLIEEFRRVNTSEKYDAPGKWYNSATVDNVLNPDKNASEIFIDTFVKYSKRLPETQKKITDALNKNIALLTDQFKMIDKIPKNADPVYAGYMTARYSTTQIAMDALSSIATNSIKMINECLKEKKSLFDWFMMLQQKVASLVS